MILLVKTKGLVTSFEIFTLTKTNFSSEKHETENQGGLLMSYQDH